MLTDAGLPDAVPTDASSSDASPTDVWTDPAATLLAHGDETTSLTALDAVPALLALVALGVYAVGLTVLWRRPAGRSTVPPGRAACLVTGVVVASLAVMSPVDHLAHELFAAHMAQHLLLASVAAPLVVAGRPVLVTSVALGHRVAGLTRPVRRWAARARGPRTVVLLALLHLVPWYLWHLPAGYDLALRSPTVHVVEHLTLVASGAALAWLAVGRLPALPALAAVGAGMLTMGLIAALLALAPVSFYTEHQVPAYGITPEESQQMGGALMWFPGSLPYLVAGGLVVSRLVGPGAAPIGPRRQDLTVGRP